MARQSLVAADAGTVTVADQALPARPQAWVAAGVARIPEDRHAVGVVGDLPLWQNAVLEHYASPSFSRWGLLRRSAARTFAQGLVRRFDVRGTESAGVATLTRSLSGGNMQKLILGAALLLISEDLDEVFALADHIAVMHHGRLTAPRPTADWTLAAIGLAMAGSDAAAPSTTPQYPDPAPHAA